MSCMVSCGNELELVHVGDIGAGKGKCSDSSSSSPISRIEGDPVSDSSRVLVRSIQLPLSSYSSKVIKRGVPRSRFASHSRSQSARVVVLEDSHDSTGDGKGGIGEGRLAGASTSWGVLPLDGFLQVRAFFTCLTPSLTVRLRFLKLLDSRRNLLCVGSGESGSGARAPLRE